MSAERTQLTLSSADGTALVAQRWTPLDTPRRAGVLIVPGYGDHAERFREVALHLAPRGLEVVAIDLRGHGRSAGQRGYVKRWADYHDDIEAALMQLPGPHFVLAHSMGAMATLDWIAHRSPALAGVVLTNPYLGLAMKVNPAKLIAGHIFARLLPKIALPSGLPPEGMSHDPAIVEEYRRDPLIFDTANASWFGECTAAQTRVRAMTKVDVPLFYIYSDADPIASPPMNAALAEAITSPDKTVLLRPGEYHEVLNEVARAELHQKIGDWILARVP
jgi:lysophospholipase